MGKILLEFIIPALLTLIVFYRIARYWYLKRLPAQLNDVKELKKASRKYKKEMK